MKTKVQKFITTTALGLALFSNSLPAWAGMKLTREVEFHSGSGGAYTVAVGSTGGARYSTDSTQYIGCSFSNTNSPFVMCSAREKTGKSLVCTITDAKMSAVIKTVTDFSRLYFEVPRGSASCQFLTVENDSTYLK